MKWSLLLVQFSFLLIFSCKGRTNIATQVEITNKNEPEFVNILNDSVQRRVLDMDDIKIISKRKGILESSSMKDTSICEYWNISDEHIKYILKYAQPIDPEEWHYAFDVLPCILEGKLNHKGTEYEYRVNAGSWIDLGGKNLFIRMGFYQKDSLNLFLSKPYSPEDEK